MNGFESTDSQINEIESKIKNATNEIRDYEQQYNNDIKILANLELNTGGIYNAKREELSDRHQAIILLRENLLMMYTYKSQILQSTW